MHVEKLIQQVQNNPAIWNRTCFEYTDRVAREKAWSDIGEEMCETWEEMGDEEKLMYVKELKSKWRNIRDHFMKNLNQAKKRKYIYARDLEFLLNYDKKGGLGSNTDEETMHEDTYFHEIEQKPDISLVDHELFSTSQESFPSKVKETPTAKPQKSQNDGDDADKSFLLSLLPDLRNLDPQEKIDFKIMVLQYFKNNMK